MKMFIKYFVIIWFIHGVGFWLTVLLLDVFRARTMHLDSYFFQSVFLGLFLSTIYTIIAWHNLKDIGLKDFSTAALDDISKSEFESQLSLQEIKDKLSNSDYFKKEKMVLTDNALQLSCKSLFRRRYGVVIMKSFEKSDGSLKYSAVADTHKSWWPNEYFRVHQTLSNLQEVLTNEINLKAYMS